FYTKAVYIKGSCFAELKKYSEALINFETLAKMDNDHVAKDIKDAAILGKARMYVITKKYDSALAEYQRIDTLSIYYLKSLEETARLFVQKKDFENAVLNLETLVFVNKDLYLPDKIKSITDEETFTDFELMKLRILQAYLYIDQQRFDDSRQVFDEVILHYNRIKQDYADALNSFKLSDDLTQVISHPYKDGSPRSMITNPEFVMFLDDTKYSKAFRDWLPEKDKRDFLRTLTLYYSLLQRANSLELKRNTRSLSDEEIRLIELKNIMKSAVSDYIKALVFKVKAQIDEIGLKAQLGKIDIVWKTKEGQTRKIKEIQEKKQENLDVIDTKYKNTAE
ncbi:MAG: hypothetical protein WCQ53_03510, partial [bacterium]